MSNQEFVNGNNGPAPTERKSKHTEKPRDSEYNLPTLLTDSSRKPSRNFQRGNLLGTGGFAKVFLVTDEATRRSYADKVISKAIFQSRSSSKKKVEREISIHRKMKHVNIITFHRFFEDSSFVHILLELAPQKTLLHVNKYRKVINEYEARYYTKQIMAGTIYIHSQQVLHRDLKLGNMFLSSNMVVKIGDFGLATSFADNQPGSLCGTPNYIAPEVLAKKGHSTASEVWSIGCMVYALMCGAPPFETDSVTTTYQLISNCDYKIPSHISLLGKEFLQSMLCPDPHLRGCLAEPPPTSRGVNLQVHSFLVEGFTPDSLPCSALNTAPVFNDVPPTSESRGLAVKKSHPVVKIPATAKVNQSSGFANFSPLFSPSKLLGSFFPVKKNFLDQVISSLDAWLAVSNKKLNIQENDSYEDFKVAPVYVSKWVDYTNKFGFGFQMSDGSVGVLFNDNTTIGATVEFSQVQFTDLNGKTLSFKWDENANQTFPELQERMDILQYYVNYMEKNLADSITFLPGMEIKRIRKKSQVPQLKLWSRRDNYVAMELTNMVQVNHMLDHIKVVIWSFEGRLMVTIINHLNSQTISLRTPCPLKMQTILQKTLEEVRELSRKEPVK